MAKSSLRTLITLILGAVLSSCINSTSSRSFVSATQLVPETITLKQLEMTKAVSPSPFDLRSISSQVTDGNLLFSIETDTKCFGKERIPIRLIFKNISKQPIYVRKSFLLTNHRAGINGNVMTVLKEKNGKEIFAPSDEYVYDTFWVPSNDYFKINANESVTINEIFRFPIKIESTDKTTTVTPEPGNYSLRMIYASVENGQLWGGILASNQINLCIVE